MRLLLLLMLSTLSLSTLAQTLASEPLDTDDNSQLISQQTQESVADSGTQLDSLTNQLTKDTSLSQPQSINALERQQIIEAKADSLRIGFVNFRRIMASIPQLKAVSSTLDREFSQQKMTLAQKQNDLSDMERKLSSMNRGDAYSDYEKQVIAKRRDYVREEAAYRDAYSVRRNEELAKLQRIVVDEIVNLAKESEFDIILNDTGVIFVSEEADLTTIVIERLRSIGE